MNHQVCLIIRSFQVPFQQSYWQVSPNLTNELLQQLPNNSECNLRPLFGGNTQCNWLVVWNMFFSPCIGDNHPNWRTHIFQRGRSTTNQVTPQNHEINGLIDLLWSFDTSYCTYFPSHLEGSSTRSSAGFSVVLWAWERGNGIGTVSQPHQVPRWWLDHPIDRWSMNSGYEQLCRPIWWRSVIFSRINHFFLDHPAV